MVHQDISVDVVICGAGLAGLTLARQLKLEMPDLSVAVVDRLKRPLPEAALKVGESALELATHYFCQALNLEDYFEQRHLDKLGLRFFYGDPHGPFEDRPELGPSLFPPVSSIQIDRGRLENDLREIIAGMGVQLFEGTVVENISLARSEEPHKVSCRRLEDAERFTLSGRWVVDALGRRRFLQTKLNLSQSNGHTGSAAWFRINGRLDVDNMATKPNRNWLHRNVEDRYWSTNHLMGKGYWVWFIPLSSGSTSVGIVTDETIHPLNTYGKTYAQALEWLREHEPSAWHLLHDHEPLDFHALKNYSYHARQLFSHQRWSCVGEAGFFLDPLYSFGSEFIAIMNTITVEMIGRDRQGQLEEADIAMFNQLVLDELAPLALAYYKGTYATFGHAHIHIAKFTWDIAVAWSLMNQLYFQDLIRRPTSAILALARRYRELNERVQRLFIDWAEKAPARAPFIALADVTRMSLMQLLHLDLAARRSYEQFLDIAQKNLDRFEELAQVLFWQAVEECLPEELPVQRSKLPWVDAWAISLDPDMWGTDGLFIPGTAPRPLGAMRNTFAGIFAPLTLWQRLRIELPYWLLHFSGGKLNYTAVRFVVRHFIENKPVTWPRRFFMSDRPSVPNAEAADREEPAAPVVA